MTYQIREFGMIGSQSITATSTTKNHPLGTIVRAFDPAIGEGEFIYLTGVASTVAGSAVTYNPLTGATSLAPAGSNIPQGVAFAMSANVASQYGWYQIGGLTTAAKTTAATLNAGAAVGITGTGVVNATATGAELQGAVVAAVSTASATTVSLSINRPVMQGRIT